MSADCSRLNGLNYKSHILM